MTLKLVLEPIFEADFYPTSYGFRRGRSTHDALADLASIAPGKRQRAVTDPLRNRGRHQGLFGLLIRLPSAS